MVILVNELEFTVNRSHFLELSELVPACIIIIYNKQKIGTTDFILSTVVLLQNS